MAADNDLIIAVLESQYRAAFAMLSAAIVKVPTNLWHTHTSQHPVWQLTFHTLWAAKMYLSANPWSFTPWQNAHRGAENLSNKPTTTAHTPSEILSFIDDIQASLAHDLSQLPLHAPSGFEWYPVSRLELHLVNIRHIQHHTAQIIERLKSAGISGFDWVIKG
ncbi:DinB family protein [Emticicia sp. 21SJ11W-3]|uniref:DinB family protein n=1 Tax=Emticicia sp. 21SJ11W-3 TaxID=2916755 RepID=UPI00209CE701|nr:DinB family protein [Emticicia sp. 21SJ11W-3]UTA66392.1 DinB family protein [Emticicia sp. 21SJ11W-3]